MKLKRSKKFGNDEQGSALLIALFALLLIEQTVGNLLHIILTQGVFFSDNNFAIDAECRRYACDQVQVNEPLLRALS